MKVYINSIRFNRSLVDGPGVRTVIFFQGCDIHCKGCQNPSAWDMSKGTPCETDDLVNLLREKVANKKITLSGGEPLMQKDAVLDIVKASTNKIKSKCFRQELNPINLISQTGKKKIREMPSLSYGKAAI